MKYLIVGMVLLGSLRALGSEPRIHQYKLEAFPKSDHGCHMAAVEAGRTFEKFNPDVEMVSVACRSETARGYNIEIRYRSEDRVLLVSTTENIFLVLDRQGRFKSRETCEAKIEADRLVFENETGLAPAFAFCFHDNFTSSRLPWSLRIDGFGETNRKPYISGFPLFAVPIKIEGVSYVANLKAALLERGVRVVDVVSHSQIAMGQVTIHYYAENRIRFNSREYTKVTEPEACLAQLQEAEVFLLKTRNAPILAFCAQTTITGVTELTLVFEGLPSFETSNSIEKFEEFEACEIERAALVDFYKNTLNRPVIGGLCTRIGLKEYRVSLFETVD